MLESELAIRHWQLQLHPIHRALREAVRRQAERAKRLQRPDLARLCVTDQHVGELLGKVERSLQSSAAGPTSQRLRLTDDESQQERELQDQAAAAGIRLPLSELNDSLSLERFEVQALLICSAAEMDRSYERIFGYILDDLNRRYVCAELLCDILTPDGLHRCTTRSQLGTHGRLRRSGLLETFGERTTESRTQLRLADGVLEYLLGNSPAVAGIWSDPDQVAHQPIVAISMGNEMDRRVARVGAALAAGTVELVGLWGPAGCHAESIAARIAAAAKMPLRQFHSDPSRPPDDHVRDALQAAAACGAALLIPVDDLHDPENRATGAALTRYLANCHVPVLLSGSVPWRPTRLLACRTTIELSLTRADYNRRLQDWNDCFPELSSARADDLAGRFRMSHDELRAIRRMAIAQAGIDSNGKPADVDDYVNAACAAVAQKTRGRFLSAVMPRRNANDLIVPGDLHEQVLEIADFTRVLPQVAETWGFGRLATGGSGMKCLFTGDPGTGKTLAAEVIADRLGTPLLKVNIAEIVSKWVGETEKNLDIAFREAMTSHAVLFFDEADALFGKRGQIQHGTDRYANLEVSHLLQRLEDHEGLVVLASNLKDNIDPAFLRRFGAVLHFPRPTESERRRIWEIAFPASAPLSVNVDIAALARLDLTGAGIVSAARTAALMAANTRAEQISMELVVRAVARQFRREARVLPTRDLGTYAEYLQGQS